MKKCRNTIGYVQTDLALRDNNFNLENTHIREIFLESVLDYFVHLLTTNEKIIETIQNHNLLDSETLNVLVNQLITEMELGLVPEKDEQLYENMLIVLTTAIKDKTKKLVRKYRRVNNVNGYRFDKNKNICYN